MPVIKYRDKDGNINKLPLIVRTDDTLSDTSTNAVQNRVVKNAIDKIKTVDVTDTTPDKSAVMWIDPSENYGEVFNAAQGTPLIADTVDKMTDTSRLYILTTDQHIYYYNGTTWVDSGMIYSGITTVKQTPGESTTEIMSQKAVTDEVDTVRQRLGGLTFTIKENGLLNISITTE